MSSHPSYTPGVYRDLFMLFLYTPGVYEGLPENDR